MTDLPPMAAPQDMTRRAMNAIGPHQSKEDWRLDPDQHASEMTDEADTLARILRAPRLRRMIDRFVKSDAEAVRQQRKYKRHGKIAIWFNAIAILIGPTWVVAKGIAADPDLPFQADLSSYNFGVMGLQYAFILMAVMSAQAIIRLKPFDKWMRSRAEAEISRIGLFTTVSEARETSRPDEVPLLPLKLEYFRRYQLDIQLDYYSGRGKQHREAADKRKVFRDGIGLLGPLVGAFALAMVILATSTDVDSALQSLLNGGISEARQHTAVRELGLLSGVISAAILSALNAHSLLSQDRRNASRYESVYNNLLFLQREYLPAARQAAAEGNEEEVLSFINAVNTQISSEHQEWIDLYKESTQPDFNVIANRLPGLTRRRAQQGASQGTSAQSAPPPPPSAF